MKVTSQSLIDLLNLFDSNSQIFILVKPPISNKEAQTLFDLWRSAKRDEYGRIRVGNVDKTIEALHEKNIIRLVKSPRSSCVEIMPEGKKIIKEIVLSSEKSSFDKVDMKVDYEKIYNTTHLPFHKSKTASSRLVYIDYIPTNWFEKVLCK